LVSKIELRAVFVHGFDAVVVAPLLKLSVDLVLQSITKLDVCGFLGGHGRFSSILEVQGEAFWLDHFSVEVCGFVRGVGDGDN